MSRTLRVATIAGDGIGPEVIHAVLPVLERAAALDAAAIAWEHLPLGASHYLATGETLPQATFEHLRDDVEAILVGGSPAGSRGTQAARVFGADDHAALSATPPG